MSDSSSDTSVGSSPYHSDEEEITYVMIGEDTNTDSGDTCTGHSDDSNTVRLEEEDNKPSLDGAGCSTDTLQGSIIRLEEENIRLKKRIEELEYFNRQSLASGYSGFRGETCYLASWGSGPTTHRHQQDKVDHVGKIQDNPKRRFNPRPPKQTVTQNHLLADTDLCHACKKGYLNQFSRIFSKDLVDVKNILKYAETPVKDDDGDTILHVACLGGHVDIVKYVLLQMVADINSRGNYGRTPLMVAAENGHRQVFDLLVTQGADVSLVDDDGNNILHVACLGGNVDMVKYVLSQKVADINSRGQYGRTPLMMAAENGHRQVFDLLVTQGADVSLVDDDGNNTLNVACLGGHVDMMKYVLSRKVADMKVTQNHLHANTELYHALKKGYQDQLKRI